MTAPPTTEPEQPRKSGRAHWLLAESLVAQGNIREATVHALLALAAPAYAFHHERGAWECREPSICTTARPCSLQCEQDFRDA